MRTSRGSILLVVAVLALSVLAGCSKDDGEDPGAGACQSDDDCTGAQICDQNLNICRTPDEEEDVGGADGGESPDTAAEMDAGADTSPADTGEEGGDTGGADEDTGMPEEDTGGPEDTGEDTSMPTDTGSDTGQGGDGGPDADAGDPTTYSGCTKDDDCLKFQTCDTKIGRCKDVRQTCSADADCKSDASCLKGLCVRKCNSIGDCRGDLSCFFPPGPGTTKYCISGCDDFGGGGQQSCGPDTHCIPFYGTQIGGVCRGYGGKKPGDTCADDWGAGACQKGAECVSGGNVSVCRNLCSMSANKGCVNPKFCHEVYDSDGFALEPAGICRINCGGVDSARDSRCPGNMLCDPISGTRGVCEAPGGGTAGQDCRFDGTKPCQAGFKCVPAGSGGYKQTPATGICKAKCDPNSSQSQCAAGEACFYLPKDLEETMPGQKPALGACIQTCDPKKPAAQNSCGAKQPRCIPVVDRSGVQGRCAPAGNLPADAKCTLAESYACKPDYICTPPGGFFGAQGGGGTSPRCQKSCVAWDFGGTSRCGSNELCGIRNVNDPIGACMKPKDTASMSYTVGANCRSRDRRKWCRDSAACADWDRNASTPPTCEIACSASFPTNVCPSGGTCNPVQAGMPVGICK